MHHFCTYLLKDHTMFYAVGLGYDPGNAQRQYMQRRHETDIYLLSYTHYRCMTLAYACILQGLPCQMEHMVCVLDIRPHLPQLVLVTVYDHHIRPKLRQRTRQRHTETPQTDHCES